MPSRQGASTPCVRSHEPVMLGCLFKADSPAVRLQSHGPSYTAEGFLPPNSEQRMPHANNDVLSPSSGSTNVRPATDLLRCDETQPGKCDSAVTPFRYRRAVNHCATGHHAPSCLPAGAPPNINDSAMRSRLPKQTLRFRGHARFPAFTQLCPMPHACAPPTC